jgi:hypothetical protein
MPNIARRLHRQNFVVNFVVKAAIANAECRMPNVECQMLNAE